MTPFATTTIDSLITQLTAARATYGGDKPVVFETDCGDSRNTRQVHPIASDVAIHNIAPHRMAATGFAIDFTESVQSGVQMVVISTGVGN
jgi:hypothetical protein